jgi:hypothetical protein
MERKRFPHVLKIDELANLAVRIAGDVNDCPVPFRSDGEAMDWHDRKKLAERPVIEERLENGKVANVLIA